MGANHYGDSTILVAEERTLHDGLYKVDNAGFQHIIVEGDNATVIQVLKGSISLPWQIKIII